MWAYSVLPSKNSDGLVEPRSLEHVLADDVVHGGDAPSCGDEPAVAPDAKGTHRERLLDLGYQGPVAVRGYDGVGSLHVGVVEPLLEVPLEPAVPHPHALHPGRGAEGLDLVVQDDPAAGLLGEGGLDVHGLGRQCQLLHVVHDPPVAPEVGGVYAVLPPDETEPEVHYLVDGLPHPHLGTVHDGRVTELRREERPDVHLRIPVASDEYGRGAGPGQVLGVDERHRPLLRVELDHEGTAVLTAEPVRSLAYGAEAVLHGRAVQLNGLVEERSAVWSGHLGLVRMWKWVKQRPVGISSVQGGRLPL